MTQETKTNEIAAIRRFKLEGLEGQFELHLVPFELPQDQLHKIASKKLKDRYGNVEKDTKGKDIWLTDFQLEAASWDIIGRMRGARTDSVEVIYEDAENVRVAMSVSYYNETTGILTHEKGEYHIDCRAVYQGMRLDWRPKKLWEKGVETNEVENPAHAGFPKETISYSPDNGMPIIQITLPPDVEKDILRNFFRLVRNRHKTAETNCKRSLIQRIMGKRRITLRENEKPMLIIPQFIRVASKHEGEIALGDLLPSDERFTGDDVIDMPKPTELISSPQAEVLQIQQPANLSEAKSTASPSGMDTKSEKIDIPKGPKKCTTCQRHVSDRVYTVSMSKYNTVVCYECQQAKTAMKVAA